MVREACYMIFPCCGMEEMLRDDAGKTYGFAGPQTPNTPMSEDEFFDQTRDVISNNKIPVFMFNPVSLLRLKDQHYNVTIIHPDIHHYFTVQLRARRDGSVADWPLLLSAHWDDWMDFIEHQSVSKIVLPNHTAIAGEVLAL